MMVIIKDRTSELENLKLGTINEHKDSMLANVTHDLRAPLNAINIHLEDLLHSNQLPPNLQEPIQIVLKNTAIMASQINDLLDSNQIKQGVFRLQRMQFQIEELINELIELFSPQVKSKNIYL